MNSGISDIFGAVSCVIPAYNAAETIERALLSVLSVHGMMDVIVVDDGSTDETASIVERVARNAPIAVHLFRQENLGSSSARNLGIEKALGEWVAFLDADDEMLANSLVSKIDLLNTCGDSNAVSAIYGGFLAEGLGVISSFKTIRGNVVADEIGVQGCFPGGCPAFVFRREMLILIGKLDIALRSYEDFDMVLRMLQCGGRIVGNNTPGYVRYYTTGSLTRGNRGLTLARERQFLKKAWHLKLMSRKETARRFFINLLRSGVIKNWQRGGN